MIGIWVNTVIALIGVVLGGMLAVGSVISIANMKVAWAGALLVAAFFVPVMFFISGAGVWIAHWLGASHYITALMALPWGYLALFIAAMLISFWFV